jgi:hypothetical protein
MTAQSSALVVELLTNEAYRMNYRICEIELDISHWPGKAPDEYTSALGGYRMALDKVKAALVELNAPVPDPI